jgi:hypothetical protein
MSDFTHAYVGRCGKCQKVLGVCADIPEDAKETAKFTGQMIRAGHTITRLEKAQSKSEVQGDWCECKKSRRD